MTESPIPPSSAVLAQLPPMRWSDLGRVCGRGRFMVPGVEDLRDVEAIQAALVLALVRGAGGRRTWLRHAPILRAAGAWAAYLDDEALGRVYGYALRAGNLRHSLEVYRLPTSARLLPFATWHSLIGASGECHGELHKRSARIDDPLWERFFPPLGYDCTCWLGVVNLAKARREGAPELNLRAADLERLAPAGWVGPPPPVDRENAEPARAAMARAQAMLDAAGLDWPQSAGLSTGASAERP